MDYPATIDAGISAGVPTFNDGAASSMLIGTQVVGSAYFNRGLFRFAINEIAGSQLSATLTLKYASGQISGSQTFTARRVTQTGWTEGGATWNTYNGTTAWATSGLGTSDYTTMHQATCVLTAVGDLVFDLSGMAQYAIDNLSGFLNVVVIGPETITAKYVEVYSSEAAVSVRPTLSVAVCTVEPGLQFSIPNERTQFSFSDEGFQFSIPNDRTQFSIPDEGFQFSIPNEGMHFSLPSE